MDAGKRTPWNFKRSEKKERDGVGVGWRGIDRDEAERTVESESGRDVKVTTAAGKRWDDRI